MPIIFGRRDSLMPKEPYMKVTVQESIKKATAIDAAALEHIQEFKRQLTVCARSLARHILGRGADLTLENGYSFKNGILEFTIILSDINELPISLPERETPLKDWAKVYLCDPAKNVDCPKTMCHINGGDCMATTHREYAKRSLWDKIKFWRRF